MSVEVNHEQLGDLLQVCYSNRKPLLLKGTTGIGKSDKIQQFSEEKAEQTENRELARYNQLSKEEKREVIENPEQYYLYIDVRLAEMEPSDVKGIPNLESNGAVEWKPPMWVYAISRPGAKGIVFLDEFNLAPPSVQSAFYQLILDREMGSHSVAEDVFILGAGNRVGEDRANVYEVPAPLRNRFFHARLQVPSAGKDGGWTTWAVQNDLDERVVGFLASPIGEDKLFDFDENKDSDTFATPRMWEHVAQQINGVEDKDMVRMIVASGVGEGIATEFAGFLDMRDKVELSDYIEEPEKISELDEMENSVDLKSSVVTGLAAELKADKDVLKPLVKIASHMEPEFSSLLLKMAKNYQPKYFDTSQGRSVADFEEFSELADVIEKYII